MPLAFLHPWVLAGLLILPLIYFLLRVIPPAARKVVLPTTRFLHDLEQKNPPVHKTPWWILLLRLLMLALLIIGLAHPVLNPGEKLSGSGPVLLIVDNTWAASQTWSDQQQAALSIAEQAKRERRPIKLVLTAPLPGEIQPQIFATQSPDQVIGQLKSSTPTSWPGKPDLVAAGLSPDDKKLQAYWITTGLAETGYGVLLAAIDGLQVYAPAKMRYPELLRGPVDGSDVSLARVEATAGAPLNRVQVRALDRKGQMIDQVSVNVTGGQGYVDVPSNLPASALKTIAQLQLAQRTGAGALVLKDRAQSNNRIAMISAESGKDSYNLSSPAYYISRAVEPFAQFTTGPIETLLKEDPGLIVLAEGGALPPRTLELLTDWVDKGGILLRFANTALAEDSDPLTPVPLRHSERSLQGNLTWEKPLTIKSINASSPLAGLSVPTDITIRRQLLAEPVPELAGRSWVTLSDETPLITAKYQNRGLLVLVHTTATPDWSDMPLSGLYVDLFRKLTELAAQPNKNRAAAPTLQPILILNGYGQLIQPPATLKPVERGQFATLQPSSLTPPGFYGSQEESYALNLGDRLPPLEPIQPHVKAQNLITDSGAQEVDLAPVFLGLTLLLFLADMILVLAISGLFVRMGWALALLILILPHGAAAAESDADLAGQLHLAYIRTGDPVLDQISQEGLDTLSRILEERTAVEPGKAVGVTPGVDTLAFYPLIFWPISSSQPDLSPAGQAALQAYLDRGGMILIDTRDGVYTPGTMAASAQITRMRELLSGLSINPMLAAPENHVFFKTFYLLNLYPELAVTGDVWVEDDALEDGGAVSSIVITGHDWARMWAASPGSIPSSQQEQAYRFGINAVMYALTGNYKADQVHMQAILERLGQ